MNVLEAIEAKSDQLQTLWTLHCACRGGNSPRLADIVAYGGDRWLVFPRRRERPTGVGRWVDWPAEARRLDDPDEEWPSLVQCPRCQVGYLFEEVPPGGVLVTRRGGYIAASLLTEESPDEWTPGQPVATFDATSAEPPQPTGVGRVLFSRLGRPTHGTVAPD